MKTNLLQELENIRFRERKNHVFRPLHFAFGFDFEKDFDVIRLEGRFTLKKIDKVIAEAGYANWTSRVVLILHDPASLWNSDRYIVFDYAYDRISVDYRCPVYGINSNLDRVFRKSDFEDMRKSDTLETFIVCQKYDDLCDPYKKPEIDYKGRFIVGRSIGFSDGKGHSFEYSRVDLTTTDGRNYKFEYKTEPTNDTADFIDKSGYLVDGKRDNLKRRAQALRDKRIKDAYIATNNNIIIKQLSDRVQALHNQLVQEFKAVSTSNDMKALNDKLSWYRGFQGVLDDLEFIVKADSEKRYKSIERFNNAVQELNEKIDTIAEKTITTVNIKDLATMPETTAETETITP